MWGEHGCKLTACENSFTTTIRLEWAWKILFRARALLNEAEGFQHLALPWNLSMPLFHDFCCNNPGLCRIQTKPSLSRLSLSLLFRKNDHCATDEGHFKIAFFRFCILSFIHFKLHQKWIECGFIPGWCFLESSPLRLPSLERVSWPLYLKGLHPDPCLAWSEASLMHLEQCYEGCCALRGRTTGLAFVS